jgi:hypothetical protein
MLAEDTLCLTKEGYWKRWNQLSLGELVYVFDLHSGTFKLEPVKQLLIYPFISGYLLKIGEQIITPDHRLVVSNLIYGRFCFSKAEQVFGNRHEIRLNAGLVSPVFREEKGVNVPFEVATFLLAGVDMAEVFFEGKVWAPVTVSKTFVAKRGSETFVTGI